MNRRAVLAAALIAGAMGACGAFTRKGSVVDSSDRYRGDGASAVVQLIVVFRGDVDPTDPAFLAKFSQEVGIPLAYLHPMSGGAHVLRAYVAPESVAGVVRRLKHSPEIADVQLDVSTRRQQS